jgi:hypothetical protein
MHTFSICTLNTLQNITKTLVQDYREGYNLQKLSSWIIYKVHVHVQMYIFCPTKTDLFLNLALFTY